MFNRMCKNAFVDIIHLRPSPAALFVRTPLQLMSRTIATKTIPHTKRNRRPNRHRDEKFRAFRGPVRNVQIELEDFEFHRRAYRDEVTPEEKREKAKKLGLNPSDPWIENPFYLSSTGAIIDAFVPPEGDGKASLLSKAGGMQLSDRAKGQVKTKLSIRKIRSLEESFDPREWMSEAEEIYINAHKALANLDEEKLHILVTEKCFPEMMYMAKRKTIRWEYLKTLEPPRIVHARHADVLSKDNLFGQVTVRFHSQQTLAVYDRFGRLIHGNEHVAKDVLEYCVFERHLTNVYGTWRLHSKIIPDWMPKRESPGLLTFVVKQSDEPLVAQETADSGDQQEEDQDAEDDKKEHIYDRFGKKIAK